MNIRNFLFVILYLVCVSQLFALDERFEQGMRFEAKGEYDKALGEYRSILAEDPKNADAYFAAAKVRLKMKDFSGALANYRLAYKFNPKMSEAYEGAAKVYESLGQKSKAEAERAKDPKNLPIEEDVQETISEKSSEIASAVQEPSVGKEEKVEPPLEKEVSNLKEVKSEPIALAEKEVKSVEIKQEKEVVFEDEKNLDPFEKGKILLSEGKYKEASPLWREVLLKKPGDLGAYFYAGVTRYELGEFDKAEFNLKKGISYKECGNDANYYLAMIYQKTNRLELEKKSLNAYLKKAPPDGKFRKASEERLAQISASSSDSIKQDEPILQEVQVPVESTIVSEKKEKILNKKDSVNLNESSMSKANVLFKSQNFEQALQMYKAIVESEVSLEERYFAMLQMGNIYRELRDFHSAVSRYREIVQQYPDSDWAFEAERALEDAVWLEKHANELPRKNH